MRSIAFSLNLTPCCYNDYSGLLQDYQLKAAHTTHATHHYQIHISYLAKNLKEKNALMALNQDFVNQPLKNAMIRLMKPWTFSFFLWAFGPVFFQIIRVC